ncbi:MAG TPA: efflux RND transporter periplasmic adaptor subunit [Gemmatimonadaceae bacterium]|nr:efflux RND transporter periplasmic adaptor subunit [Gemmatimonadaceae bacterium]
MPLRRRRLALALILSATSLAASLAACSGKGSGGAAGSKTAGQSDSKSDSKASRGAGGSDTTAVSSRENTVNLPVVAEEVRDGDLVLTINTTGQVRSEAESKLKVEVGGTVQKVLIRPGDRVKAGQQLVVLDPRPFALAVRDAEVALERADRAARDEWEPDSIAFGKAPSAERRKTSELRNGVPAARLALERARLDSLKSVTIAPFDGMVDRVNVSAGERVSGGQDVTTIVDLDHLRIEAAVLEHDLPLIKVGGYALVTSAAARDESANGRVVAVLPLVDSTTRAGRVYVRLSGSGVLRPGMYADIRLEATRLTKRRIVPFKAVIERDGRPLVFVVRNGRAQWTYVTPGRSNGRETEILPDSTTGQIPVKPGDLVITEGHLTLTHDAPVRVMAMRETAPAKP